MEEREELLQELMRHVQQKYMRVVEIEKLTKELGDVLSRDDRESVQLLLEMRQDEMDKADEAERAISTILNALDSKTEAQIRELLDAKKELSRENTGLEERKIKELSVQIRNSLDRTIQIDRIISRKLAGKDSYYS